MAILRGREVQIETVVHDQDPSTFQVRYQDGETEIVKMHELEFTQDEYDQFIKRNFPQPRIIDQTRLNQVRELTQPVKEEKTEAPKTMQVKTPVKK